jgi:hypothetical protein
MVAGASLLMQTNPAKPKTSWEKQFEKSEKTSFSPQKHRSKIRFYYSPRLVPVEATYGSDFQGRFR